MSKEKILKILRMSRMSRIFSMACGGIVCILVVQTFSDGTKLNNHLKSLRMANNVDSEPVKYNGIENCEWCKAPKYPRLPYDKCKHTEFILRYGVYGGLTNALHFLLKGAIWAFEEELCFFVDEKAPTQSKLAARDPPIPNVDPFLERYFEPIGLPRNHKKVKHAFKHHMFADPGYHQIQYHEFGKFSGGILDRDDPIRHQKRDIESLYLYNKDSIWTKKWIMRRLFRILPKLRDEACGRLGKMGLEQEFIGMSVRRGDKSLEFELDTTLQPYIDKAEIAIKTHFNNIAPKIFVASDDCSVMQELRDLRPEWVFVGECDNATESNGFVIAETKKWTLEQTDNHYEKFVTEMIALASAKYFIGISNTNVALWVYFMRDFSASDDTWAFVDGDKLPH